LKSRPDFSIKKAVSSDPLIIRTDSSKFAEYTGNKVSFGTIYMAFKLVRTTYTSVYFYFFPFFICALPVYNLVILRTDDDPNNEHLDPI